MEGRTKTREQEEKGWGAEKEKGNRADQKWRGKQ